MGTHIKALTKLSDAAHSAQYLMVKEGTDDDHVAICTADDLPLGVCSDQPSAAEDYVAVNMLGAQDETLTMVASEAIDSGEAVYTADDGKVQGEPASAGTYYLVGYARSDASGDGVELEVEPCAPVKTIVVAAQTSESAAALTTDLSGVDTGTDMTAAQAAQIEADLAALKTAIDAAVVDIAALGTALAGPAVIKILSA